MTVWTEMAAEIKKILDGAGFTAMPLSQIRKEDEP